MKYSRDRRRGQTQATSRTRPHVALDAHRENLGEIVHPQPTTTTRACMPRMVIGGERAQERVRWTHLHTHHPTLCCRSARVVPCMLHRVRDLANRYDARLCLLLYSAIVNGIHRGFACPFGRGHMSWGIHVFFAGCGLPVRYHLTRHDRPSLPPFLPLSTR